MGADARHLAQAISRAKGFIDRATTIEQLHTMEQNSPALVKALNDLATYGVRLGDWRKAHCH